MAPWKRVWQPQPNGSMLQPQANRCVDVSGAGTADGTKVQLFTCNHTGAQVWEAQAKPQILRIGAGGPSRFA